VKQSSVDRVRRLAVVCSVVALALGGVASAHEQRTVGAIALRVGWQNEPAYTGTVNAVLVEVTRGGSPVTDAKLNAVVGFGDKESTTKTSSLALEGTDETPGTYTAPLVPTRPGTYTFHISGNVGDSKIDTSFTSGETTFDDVTDPTAAQFPAKDPTSGQLAQRIENVDSAAAKAASDAKRATIALAVGALGVLIGLVALLRRR
jgi:hypothetical protein